MFSSAAAAQPGVHQILLMVKLFKNKQDKEWPQTIRCAEHRELICRVNHGFILQS